MIETYGIKYIGSKKTLNQYIWNLVKDLNCKTAIDVFTGTTRVAQCLRQNDIQVYTSDTNWASEAYAHTWVHNPKPNYHLQPIIDELNDLEGFEGWITKTYCDTTSKGNKIRVWQKKNGMRADMIREHIETLTNLQQWEKFTLITSLILALDKVDNTVGVQQAYLKNWCNRSKKDLKLKLPPTLNQGLLSSGKDMPVAKHFVGNALEIDYPSCDLAYLDPPYSPHSYATYYHIWDSITRWDKPEVSLKTNRRIDRVSKSESYDKSIVSSAWNRKKDALKAYSDLIDRLDCKYILCSYSSDSLINQDNLLEMCQTKGKVDIDLVDYKRNIMSQIGNMKKDKIYPTENQEILILIEKS